ncbi:MAG: phosphohistidine phosphatase SixA [Nitrososphaeraceae archaeon]
MDVFLNIFIPAALLYDANIQVNRYIILYVITHSFGITMELFILRHGEAGQRLSSNPSDRQRSLTATGKEEVMEVAKALKKFGTKFDLIASSPLKRAYETAAIVANVFKMSNKLQTWSELAPEGVRSELYRKICRLRQEYSILLVGHEPQLSEIVNDIIHTGRTKSAKIVLKKAGLVRIRVIASNPVLCGELRWLLTPKILTSK